MSNDKLAEALRRTCRKMKTFSRTGALDGAVAVWVDEIESALQAHAAEAARATTCACCGEHKPTPLRIDNMGGYVCLTCIDKRLTSLLDAQTAQAQAQSSEWVMVPREPTREMQTAGKHVLKGSADSPEWQRAIIVYQAMLAAAPQQAAGPVAWLIEHDCNPATAIATTSIAVVDGLRGNRNRITPLYTHPQSAKDAQNMKDAAERLCQVYFEIAAEAIGEDEVRRRRDAAMAKESGR